MARMSNLPTFPNLPMAQSHLMTDPDVIMATRRTKSGPEYTDLTGRMHAEDSRCVACNLPTLFSRWDGPQTATLAHLLPSSLLLANADGETYGEDTLAGAAYRALRVGYCPGNMAVMCRACVDASNAYGNATGALWFWLVASLVGADRVWCAWPRGLRRVQRPTEPTGDDFRAVVRAARGHAANAARARASQGLPF